jgi:3-oxo-5-alpha-steroid 4-dehydrogenase 3
MYESCYINVFSESKMHLLHYLIGFIHYMLLFVCIIGEAEGFVRGIVAKQKKLRIFNELFFLPSNLFSSCIGGQIYFSWNKLTSIKLAYGFMFLWLSYIQFKTNIILRNLRKSKHNNVVSYTYKMPCHGLFKYISAPLQLTEILMYLTLSVILSEASTFHYITFWVLVNQVRI